MLTFNGNQSESAPFTVASQVYRHGAILFGSSLQDVRRLVSPEHVTKSLSSMAYRKKKIVVSHFDHYRKKGVTLRHHHQPFLEVATFPCSTTSGNVATQQSNLLPTEILKYHKVLKQCHFSAVKYVKKWLKSLHSSDLEESQVLEKIDESDWNGFSLRLNDKALSRRHTCTIRTVGT